MLFDFAAERRAADFAGFIHGDIQQAAVAAAQGAAQLSGSAYLWGAAGHGKTHLLSAAVSQAAAAGHRLYHRGDEPAGTGLVVIDDVDALDGQAQEDALRMLNAVLQQPGHYALCAGAVPARQLQLRDDLRTRLEALPSFELPQLDDDELAAALVEHAARRKRELPLAVARQLVELLPRRMDELAALLDELDLHAIEANLRLNPASVRRWLKETGRL